MFFNLVHPAFLEIFISKTDRLLKKQIIKKQAGCVYNLNRINHLTKLFRLHIEYGIFVQLSSILLFSIVASKSPTEPFVSNKCMHGKTFSRKTKK